MWEFTTEGRGRRAKILGATDGVNTYNLGDVVAGDEFLGIITSFKRGDSEKLHSAQMSILLHHEDEILATSKLKSASLSNISHKSGVDLFNVKRAADHRRRNLNAILDLPEDFNFKDPQSYSIIDALFSEYKSPRKRRAQSAATSKPVDEVPDDLNKSDEDLAKYSDTDSDYMENAVAEVSLKSPKKPKQVLSIPDLNLAEKLEFSEPEMDEKSTEKDQSHKDTSKRSRRQQTKNYDPTSQRQASPMTVSTLPAVDAQQNLTLVDNAIMQLHPASEPLTHPCREDQFDQLFIDLENAISAETGTCIYVSGTPGTGKTSTIREVMGQLDLRVQEGELKPFSFLEINGMKLVHPNAAYEHLWEALGRGQMAASNAMTALESAFTADESISERGIMVVLLDELDQLVTKGQQLMYNFFNWPSLPNSRLIVIAVANTMDLPERLLSNKISSRVGLTRVQFPGYTFAQLHEILLQRLDSEELRGLIEPEALEYAARKVAGVGGDARRALDFIRQAIAVAELRGDLPVKTAHVRDITVKAQESPMTTFLSTLGYATKVLLCAIVTRTRRTENNEAPLHDVLRLANQLVHSSANADIFHKYLYSTDSPARLKTFQSAIMELVEGGILLQQAIRGEATPLVRLMIPVATIKEVLGQDKMLHDMI